MKFSFRPKGYGSVVISYCDIQRWTPEMGVDSTAPPKLSPTQVDDVEKALDSQWFTLTSSGPTNYVRTGVAQAIAYALLSGKAGDDLLSGQCADPYRIRASDAASFNALISSEKAAA